MSRDAKTQVVHFLSDLYSMELQALAQLSSASGMTDDPALSADFWKHHGETERQAESVRARMERLGGSPSAVKNTVMRAGGKGFLLFAKFLTETPGRLAATPIRMRRWNGRATPH